MSNISDSNHLYRLLGWTLLGLLLTLLALEGWRYGIKPSKAKNKQVIEQSLSQAAEFYQAKQQQLLLDTESLGATLQNILQQKETGQRLHSVLSRFPQFWGSTLYHGAQPISWYGFAMGKDNEVSFPPQLQGDNISLQRHNNVIFWQFSTPITVQDSAGTTDYTLVTRYRIRQRNPLPIGDRHEFNLFNSSEMSSPYPLSFTLFGNAPEEFVKAKQLTNLAGDSVGVVYATADKFNETKKTWDRNTRFWRSVYALLGFIILSILLFWAVDRLPLWQALFLQLLVVGIGWAILSYTEMLSYWILVLSKPAASSGTSVILYLSSISVNALFALIIAGTISRKLNRFNKQIKQNWFLTAIVLGVVTAFINAFSVTSIFNHLYHTSLSSDVSLIELRILPEWTTQFFYLSMGLEVLALFILLVTLNRLLFRITRHQFKLTIFVLMASLVISLPIVTLVVPLQLPLGALAIATLFSLAAIIGLSVVYFRHPQWLANISLLRKTIIGSFIIAVPCLPVVYQASLIHTDEKLQETAETFARENDPRAKELTKQLLTKLEQQFHHLTSSDLQQKQGAIQTRFIESIQEFITPQRNTYSFDLQLINNAGSLITEYATDLNSPSWTQVFDIPTLKIVTNIEQITKTSLRPIVQLPQVVNHEDYRTFYRGWIPIFGKSEENPIAWILCSIYKERPEFNKPIRAVMASLTYKDWDTPYLMQKYNKDQLISSIQQGYSANFRPSQTLSSSAQNILNQDSLVFITKQHAETDFRTILWKHSDNEIIKVTTPLPDYRIILFTLFRFSMVLLIVALALILPWQIISTGGLPFFGNSQRFQDRILDSFLIATLLFLIFLIFTSHYTIKQQNQDIVRQELFDKLESLSTSIESYQQENPGMTLGQSFSLDTLSTTLNVDAGFYDKLTITETTTPQIYQQHLLPATLPYNIFHELFLERKREVFSSVTLAGQPLLIGYRAILGDQKKPIGAIAIPTFLESPKYDQQLLRTTSLLILIYLVVFGIFVIVSAIISKKLTLPLTHIQEGLQKISSGDLNTKIPVTSKDEIGNLADAYNNMVSRLKNLQEELAAAEREAAWKEMAQQVAHEIKNPLTPMKLNVQHLERQLKDGTQDPDKLKKRVQKITANLIEQIQSLSNIASDFSKFSQPLSEEFKRVNIVNTVSTVIDLYEHDERVNIILNTQRNPLYVEGIRDELKRVFINLVKNAYEAIDDREGQIILSIYQKQGHVFIEIEDNGEGIPEENRNNIFVPNFSTKSSGTGLGLAICKKIIEAHEGSISFASVEGEGTTFVIKLSQY